MNSVKLRVLSLASLLLASACSSGPIIGNTYTIASAETQRPTSDWPCFQDGARYNEWLMASSGKSQFEDANALWLEPDDTVKLVRIASPDSYFVQIVHSVTGEDGKKCWTPGYGGYFFKK